MEVDYDKIFGRDEFKEIRRNIAMCQEGLTDHNGRIKKLEDYNEITLKPLLHENFEPRIKQLEEQFDKMSIALDLKLNREDLQVELEKKADVESLNTLREAIEQLNAFVQSFTEKFADKAQNDREHKLLQKQLKALYDLIMSMNEDDEDAMFTTKGLRCAACAKGVQNLEKFKASYVPWGALPFKGAGGSRVMAVGDNFSKMFTTAAPGEMYHTQPPQSVSGTTRAENRRSMGSLDVVQTNPNGMTSPAKTPDDIFKPQGRRLIASGGQMRPSTAKQKTVQVGSGGRPISASVYKGSYF